MEVELLGKLERRISISLPRADVELEVDARLKRLSRTVKMAGFRPGKVPLRIVAQQYGSRVESEVLNEKLGNAFSQAVQAQDLHVVGAPTISIRPGDATLSGSLEFDATFEVYPDVKLGDVSQVDVERPLTQVAEPDVEKTIQILRDQRVHFHARGSSDGHGDGGDDASARGGDRVVVDFTGVIEGSVFEGGSATDFGFIVGDGKMLPEFDAAVLGHRAGDVVRSSVVFPADYHGRDVAGKTAEFTITVKDVQWPHRPEVDADFAKSLGVADGDLQVMRAEVRANLEREVRQRLAARTRDNAMSALLQIADLEVPKVLVEAEMRQLMEGARQDLQRRGMKIEDVPLPGDLFRDQAARRVRLWLIVAHLVKDKELAAKPEQVRAQIDESAKSYEKPQEVVRWYYSDAKRLAEVEARVEESNVVDYVLGLARVTDVVVPFDELMTSAPGASAPTTSA